MNNLRLPRWRKGQVIKADDLNRLAEAIERVHIERGQCSGLEIDETPGGTSLRVKRMTDGYIGVASGNITARSGSTPGAGSVTLQEYDATNELYSLGVSIPVLNASSSTMTSGNGINSGQYCWCQQDVNGFYWVSPLECA
jgi:hypothetical protein